AQHIDADTQAIQHRAQALVDLRGGEPAWGIDMREAGNGNILEHGNPVWKRGNKAAERYSDRKNAASRRPAARITRPPASITLECSEPIPRQARKHSSGTRPGLA